MRRPHDKYIPDGITKRRESGTNTGGDTPRLHTADTGETVESSGLGDTQVCAQYPGDGSRRITLNPSLGWGILGESSLKKKQWHKLAIPNSKLS